MTERKPKLTPWFPGTVKPARDAEHIGPYERNYGPGGAPLFCFWSGKRWHSSASSPEAALTKEFSPFQCEPWRGLAEKP